MKEHFFEAESYRIIEGEMGTPAGVHYGAFIVRAAANTVLLVIVDDGRETGWEHVSVSAQERKKIRGKAKIKDRTPTWEEMCLVKDMFWEKSETVCQFHPAEDDYVNQHQHCLHMWRHCEEGFPTPSPILVGFQHPYSGEDV